MVPDGLGHAMLLLPSHACLNVRGGASEGVQAMFFFGVRDEPVERITKILRWIY